MFCHVLSRLLFRCVQFTCLTIPGRVAQSVTCLATDASLTADPGVESSILARSHTFVEIDPEIISTVILQGFSLASAIGHSPKIVPDVREFAVQFGHFVRDDFRKRMLYGNAQ